MDRLQKQEVMLEKRVNNLGKDSKSEDASLSTFRGLTDHYNTLSDRYSEKVHTLIAKTFYNHFQENDFKSEGFGEKLYAAVDDYFKKELLEAVPEDKITVRNLINQMNEGQEHIIEHISSEDKISFGILSQLTKILEEKVENTIKTALTISLCRKVEDNFEGFKTYLKEIADMAGIPLDINKVTTVYTGLKVYHYVVEFLKQRRKKKNY